MHLKSTGNLGRQRYVGSPALSVLAFLLLSFLAFHITYLNLTIGYRHSVKAAYFQEFGINCVNLLP